MYFNITCFLGKRGAEGLRQMTKNSLQIKLNAQDREYMELANNASTKKSDGTENNPFNDLKPAPVKPMPSS